MLDGALALAVPTRFGQSLQITPLPAGRKGQLHWQSFDEQGRLWFDGRFQLPEARLEADSDAATGERLEQILQAIQKQRPDFFNGQSTEVAARLEFPRDWGLGSSSTLIACLARWADVDPYLLLADTFGGSGYDIACAFAEGPVLYERVRGGESERGRGGEGERVREGESERVRGGRGGERVQYVDFKPDFSDRLFFIHMGKKQDSREGIRRYRAMVKDRADLVEKVTLLTKALLESRDEDTFGEVMAAHEKLVGEALGLQPVQEKYFPDFPGRIKSLGAWGGDFILALSPWESEGTKRYFGQKQLGTVLSWDAMVG